MRVLLDCRMATWTGVGRYTVGLARALADIPGIELIQVVAQGEAPPVTAQQAGAVVLTATKHPFSFGAAAELARIARDVSPDVMHCPHFPTPIPASHPLVVTLHDLTPLLVPGIMPSAFKRGVYGWWNQRAVHVADHLITDAAFTVGEIERAFPHAAGKLTAIPLAADDFATIPAEPLLTATAALLPDSAPYVLSMGSTRPHKDLPTLLHAFADVASARPDVRLLLVGDDDPGYLAAHLSDASTSVRERIAFTGRVSDGVLRTLMAEATAFAFPSRYEGFGLPPLEAMALGTPVVTARAASLPEVVGDAGLQFEPGEGAALATALARLLDDAGLRERLSASGLARAAQFTWASTAAATVDVYRAVAGGAPFLGADASRGESPRTTPSSEATS